jgi:hypothetical protein
VVVTSYSLSALVVAPSSSLTNERLFRLLDLYREHPDTDVPAPPENPAGTDFFEHIDRDPPILLGLDIGLDGSGNHGSELPDILVMPEGLGFLVLRIGTSSLEGLPDHHELFLDALKTAFVGLDAVYAVTLHEITLSVERVAWERLRELPGGVHVLSRALVEAVGRERLIGAAPMHGDLEGGGLVLRFGDEYVYGMPEECAPAMEALLGEMWSRVDLDEFARQG